jgi:uncharacterized membrane protein YdcZ (DUF606 family)
MSQPPGDADQHLAALPTVTDTGSADEEAQSAGRLRRLVELARAVADADPTEIEATARRLGESRRYLAPLAWAAGALVLLVRGIKLLILNWRLSLIELVPAAWVWLVMWDLKQHTLRGEPFRHLAVGGLVLLVVVSVVASVASFWCNTVFAFAIGDAPPRIADAARRARPYRVWILYAGIVMGLVLAVGAVGIPRIDRAWVYLIAIGALYGLMLISFVAVPARILGVRKRKLPPRETIGRWTVSGALSAVAMTPGFVLDRVGLILLGLPHLHVLGFVLLAIGTALYAAGMSSVRAVKLTMKLESTS